MDVDNDGDLDAFIAVEQGCASGKIYSFDHDSTTRDVSAQFGLTWNRLGPDVLAVDLDGSGLVDLVGFEDGVPAIFLNEPVETGNATDRHSTAVELRSEAGRTLAYGRVEAHVGDRTIVRYLAPTHGRYIGNAPVIHFATSGQERIDSFVVRYTDGSFESFPGEQAGDRQVLTKGTGHQISRSIHAIDDLAAVPNPFAREVTLFFSITQSSSVRVEIFNSSGNLVRTIVPGAPVSGRASVVWNGSDEKGDILPSGHYFYRITTANASAEGRVVLTR